MEWPKNFLPKTKFGRLEPNPTVIDWFRLLPAGDQLAEQHCSALDSAISRLCSIDIKASNAPAIHRPSAPPALPSIELTWIADFIKAVDDLRALDARVMGPMFAPSHRCNEVFQCLKKVLLHPDSSDMAIESAASLLVKLLPPPSQSTIACDTDWKPFYALMKKSVHSDKNFRTGIDCPDTTSTAFVNCIQSIAFYFSPKSGPEIIDEIRAAIHRHHFLDASALTTFLPPDASCLQSVLPDVFFLLDSALGSPPSSTGDTIDSCCFSSIAFMARCSLFPVRHSSEAAIDWSPYIDSMFLHALRLLDMFNDGNLIYANTFYHDRRNAHEMVLNVSFTIICLLFMHPSTVLLKIEHFVSRLEHIMNPLADASQNRNAELSVFMFDCLTDFFSRIMSRFHILHPSHQHISCSDVECFIRIVLNPALLSIPTLPQHRCASSTLKCLYLFRPDIVAPSIAAVVKSILQESIDCPDAFDCLPLLLGDFGAALFGPLHRVIDSRLAGENDGFLCRIKQAHSISVKFPQHTPRAVDEQSQALVLLSLLPEIAEILLPRIDASVESVSQTLAVFSNIFEHMPLFPLSQPLPPTSHVSDAAAEVVTRINSYFTRPSASQPSFCARFFEQILSFCLHADQSDQRDGAGMGSKEDESGTTDHIFDTCVEFFIVHLPLKSDLGSGESSAFSFDDALCTLLEHCRSNSSLHLPVHTFSVVSACMSAHSEKTARVFMPFLMQQLLRPVEASTPTATPLPSRRNRVVGSRNERILRYFAGILDAILRGVNSNSARTYLLDFVPQMYDLDRFLLATRLHSGTAAAKVKRTPRSQEFPETADSTEVNASGKGSADHKAVASSLGGAASGEMNGRKHQVKHLSSDGCDLVKSLLQCFSAPTTLSRARVVPDAFWHDAEWRAVHFLSWGRGIVPAHVQVSFEVPTRVHLSCASAIFRRFAIVPLRGLLDISEGVSKIEEDDLSE